MKIKQLKDRPYDDKDIFYLAYSCEKKLSDNQYINLRYSEIDNTTWVSFPKGKFAEFDVISMIKEFEDLVNKKLKKDNKRYDKKI